MKFRSIFLFLSSAMFVIGISQSARAADVWVSPVHITRVYPQADGSVVLTVDNDNNSCTNASTPKRGRLG